MFEESQLEQYNTNLKLKNMATHRWSSCAEVMKRFLSLWSTLSRTFWQRSKPFPLKRRRQELLEVYGSVEAVNEVIKAAQSNGATGPIFLTKICSLINNQFNVNKDFTVDDPTPPPPAEAGDPRPQLSDGFQKVVIQHKDMTEVGRVTREKVREAIMRRFIVRRYHARGEMKSSYIFDAAALAHPAFVRMPWVATMSDSAGMYMKISQIGSWHDWLMITNHSIIVPSTAHASIVREKIRGVVVDLLEKIYLEEEAAAAATPSSATTTGGQRRIDAFLAVTAEDEWATSKRNEEVQVGVDVRSAAQKASDEWEAYVEWATDPKSSAPHSTNPKTGLPWAGLLNWWKDKGTLVNDGAFSRLATVFKVLLTVPGGSAALERDFSVAGNIVTARRSMLDSAYVEMLLFLNLNQDYIPSFDLVPILKPTEVSRYIPRRLRDKADLEKFKKLDVFDQSDDIEDAEVESAGSVASGRGSSSSAAYSDNQSSVDKDNRGNMIQTEEGSGDDDYDDDDY